LGFTIFFCFLQYLCVFPFYISAIFLSSCCFENNMDQLDPELAPSMVELGLDGDEGLDN
jgi:hypothetical protein